MSTEGPVFQVRTKSGHHFKVWTDGRIEGFPPDSCICNMIPATIQHAAREAWVKGSAKSNQPDSRQSGGALRAMVVRMARLVGWPSQTQQPQAKSRR